MKKSLSSAQILSDNLKKYLKRAGIVVASAALGTATFITISSDKATVYSDSQMVSMAEVQTSAVEETIVEYDRIDYADLQDSIAEAEQLAQVQRSEKRLAQTAASDSNVTTMNVTTETTEKESTETENTTEASKTEEPVTEKATTEKATTEQATTAPTTEAVVADDYSDFTVEVEGMEAESGTYLGSYVVTAYCGCSKCCGKSDGITASGTKATAGRTVAAPSSLAFGTEIIIDGHTYVVEDRGGSISGNRIDIYFSSHQEALNYGRRTVDVYLK